MSSFLNKRIDRYMGAGIILVIFGLVFSFYSYLVIYEVVYISISLACLIIGFTILMIPSDPVPLGTVRAMIEGATINVEALLEEFDVKLNAFYLPPRDGRVYCYIPLSGDFEKSYLSKVLSAPLRVVTEVGGVSGLIVFPPGSEIVRLSMFSGDIGVEDALNYVLVDFLEAADSVKMVQEGDGIVVQIAKPRISTDFPRYNKSLGSLTTSIAGCIISYVIGQPIKYLSEDSFEGILTNRFRVYNG